MLSTVKKCIILAIMITVMGCASKETPYEDQPMETLYNRGMDALIKEDYMKAAELFNEVERQHPYSVWAPRAQIMSAFASYQNRQYDQAMGSLESFLNLHPYHDDTAYAYYLQGICAYEQMATIDRDPQAAQMCLKIFDNLIRKFPGSIYAKDARLKQVMMRDHWAARELEVARFYQIRGEYIATLSRLYGVVKDYQDTSHIPEALYRQVECYLALGLYQEAHRAAGVLGHNYPGQAWYEKAYKLLQRTVGTQGGFSKAVKRSETRS